MRRSLKMFALLISAMTALAAAANAQVTGVPNGGYITFNLAPGQSSAPITPNPDIPWFIMGSTTTLGYRGVGQVVMERESGSFLQWVGLNSNATGTIAQGFNGAPGTVIVQIDYEGDVNLVVNGPDSFVVTNSASSPFTATGYVSWSYFSNASAGNTILGNNALAALTSGIENTASGAGALQNTTSGSGNTATGWNALKDNTSGDYNTADGFSALSTGTTGGYTTAVGAYSLAADTTGGYNTGFGAYALNLNTAGNGNTAFGYAALRSTTTGNQNIGFGYQALYLDAAGSNNIAMGYQAAQKVAGGSNIIEIGNVGVSSDNDIIRIGTKDVQTTAYIAGIYNVSVSGCAVYVSSVGQLGCTSASSARYKTDITPMPELSAKLRELRPVTFHYKSDPHGALQYGLIAEEVDKIYPELVIRDDLGKIQGVRYEELAPMLLNELQKQQDLVRSQQARLETQAEKLDGLTRQVADLNTLKEDLRTALLELKAKSGLVAQR